MKAYKTINLKDNIDRLYVTRKEGGRGHGSIEDCIDETIYGLEEHAKKEQRKTDYSSQQQQY